MKKKLLFGLVLLVVSSGQAATTASNVTLTPNAAGNFVTIGYTLAGDNAIVTLDVLTNGVSVGSKSLRRVGGDVNRIVTAGNGNKAIWWRPSADCDVTGDDVRAVIRTWTLDNPPDYTAFELTGTKDRRFYTSEDALPYGIDSDIYRTGWLLMRRIPAMGRTFFAGSAPTEPQRDGKNREDGHPVCMKRDFWLGVFEVTQGQWEFACSTIEHGSHYTNALFAATRPVDSVWCRILRGVSAIGTYGFSSQLSQVTGVSVGDPAIGTGFDLPNEAQWEFACRAGTSTSLYSGRWLEANGGSALAMYGAPDSNLDELARYEANGGRIYPPGMALPASADSVPESTIPGWDAEPSVGTARVGSYRPNGFGLYDMLGNVSEVTCEKFVANTGNAIVYDDGIVAGRVPVQDSDPVVCRGGNFCLFSYFCRSAARVGPLTKAAGHAEALGYGCRMTLPIGK